EDGLAALAPELAALDEPGQEAAELLVDDARAVSRERLRRRDRERVDARLARQGDLDRYGHRGARLSRVGRRSDSQGAEMGESVQEFFRNLEARADPAKTAGMTNSYVFDIDGAGQWKVDVDDGKVAVTEGDAGGDADAVISASEETFEKIVAGE